MAALREFVLTVERAPQPLDNAILSLSCALQLCPFDPVSQSVLVSTDDASSLWLEFLAIDPQGEMLLRVWPERTDGRWEKRESFATFLQVVTHVLQGQQQQNRVQAEAFGLRIVRDKTAQVQKLLSWSDKPLIVFRALELLTALVNVSGVVARELVRLLNFQCPAFGMLATTRWKKSPERGQEKEKDAPFQLRAAYVDLVLALLACPDKSVYRFAMKEGGVTGSLFKSMDGDSAELVTRLFQRLGDLVLYRHEVDHKNKLVVFNGSCVHQLLALLQVEDQEKVRDTALEVLNALFFQDSALYVVPEKQALRLFLAKSASSQSDEDAISSEQAYALKVIRNAVATIGVKELLHSTQAQTLVMQFLAKYPGFLSEYLAALSVQLEPKPVYRWFCVTSLMQKLLSCSLDAVSVGMPTKNRDTVSSWCSAQTLALRLIAPGNFRKELSRSIQHSNNLVVYSSLGVIEATLNRYVRVAPLLESWNLASEVQSELRFLLPSPEALVSLLLKLCASQERSIALVYVRALTVFRLYLECVPQAMREVKVDFTKTLRWHYLDCPVDGSAESAMQAPMHSLIVGEMLRFLLAVDTARLHFLFTSSSSGGHRSKLEQMLLLYVLTPSRAVQKLAGQVLQRTLLASDIFGLETRGERHSASGRAKEEVTFWLESLGQGGGKTCAKFTEQITRAVIADPFMFVAIGCRVVTDMASLSSLSPITVALVEFLNSRTRCRGKPNLSVYRGDPCVVAFAVRILLALMPTSEHPQQLVALIASNGDFPDVDDVSAAKSQHEVTDETASDDCINKKRKRSMEIGELVHEDDAYVWLKTTCEMIVSGECLSKRAPKKKVRAASSSTWYRLSDLNALATAMVAMTPSNFCSSWEQIVSNCAEIAESFGPILHYLSARGDVDILSLLTFSATKSRQRKKQTSISTAAESFTKMVPVYIVLQHVLFTIASKNHEEQESAIAVVTSMVKSRVENHQLAATDATRMCELLLFFFSSSNLDFSKSGHSHLCDLLLNLLTIVIVSNENSRTSSIVKRLFFKLRAVITSNLGSRLGHQLSAVEIVALRVCSSVNPDTDLTMLCDVGDLFQRAGVPLVAVLASRISSSLRIAVLDKLLNQSSVMTIGAPNVVLVECVLKCLDANTQYASFTDYKRAKLLTKKLWQLLNSESSKRELSLLTSGFKVVGQLGGVDASMAVAYIETFLVPVVVRSAHLVSSGNHCTKTLRAIVTAIRSGIEAAVFPVVFEKQLSKWVQREKDERVKCLLVGAIYDVFARVGNYALRQVSKELIPICLRRVLFDSQASHSAELAMLRHLSIDGSLSVDANSFGASVQVIVEKFEKSERDESLSSAQLLALLLLSRGNDIHESTYASLLFVLMKSGVSALKTAVQNATDKHFLSDHESWPHKFEATMLLAENAVRCLKQQEQEKQVSALKMLLPLFAEMREAARESANKFAFEEFVGLTAALLRLVGNDMNVIDYDFVAHFEAVVQHPCFAQSLQNVGNKRLQLFIARVIAQLARITGNYTRSLLQTLLSSYSMSLSPFDRSLRVLFEEFEAQEKDGLTLMSMGFRFGASSTIPPSTATSSSLKGSHNDLVDDSAWVLGGGLEPNRVRATIDRFPFKREVSTICDAHLLDLDEELHIGDSSDKAEQALSIDDEQLVDGYDPAFLLPMLSHFISSSDLPDGATVQQGLLGVAIRATSSEVERIREYAFGILAHLHESLQATTETTSDFKAGRQVYLLLDVFRRSVKKPLEQVPSVVTVFLNDALAVLTRPAHVLYPQVNHFLLARPAMDLADVPMFYSLFNSQAPLTFRQERSWLLHTLRRGICNNDDVTLLVRRHVLPMLLSFFTSELADTHTQPLIANILLAALRTPSGGVYLVTKVALLEWLAAQFLRHGAVSLSAKSHNDKLSGSMQTASSALLLPLMMVLEQALHDGIWSKLDATQQHATAVQAANAFASLQTAITARRVGSKNDRSVTSKAAVIAELVVRRAGPVCSLELLHKAVELVQHSAKFERARIDLAEMIACNLTQWLVQQHHYEAQRQRFHDWAVLLRQVASILASYDHKTILTEHQRMRHALEQIKSGLDQLPTLKLLVIGSSSMNEQSVSAHTLL